MFKMKLMLGAFTYFIYLLPAYTSQPVVHSLDSEYEFTRGDFIYQQNMDSIYTLPRHPSEAPPQSIRIYAGQPQEIPEMLRMRVRPSRDGRERVKSTTEWPFLFHGQLSLYFADKDYGGSGFMVGPCHFLTAAHNVYNTAKKAWVDRATIRLALNDNVAPFDEVEAAKIYTFEQWTKDANPHFDMALIVLKEPIGLKTGWCGLLAAVSNTLISERVTITGYPADKGFKQMWSMEHKIKAVEDEQLFYDIDTYGGQSGSAVWINKWGSPYAIGVHAYGSLQDAGNSGSRLSDKKLKAITEWISETKEIQQALPRSPIIVTPLSSTPPPPPTEEELGNRVKAAHLMGRAEGGDIEAHYQLANYFYMGVGIEKDLNKAAYLYQKAAEQGHLGALYSLSVCFSAGTGVEQDIGKAIFLCQKAAELGHSEAQYQLAECLNKGNLGIQIDKEKAAFLYEKAAEQGHLESLYKLAECFSKGDGVAIDFDKANFLYLKAAERGHPEATYKLAGKYEYSWIGIEKDENKAVILYQLAAERGHPEATYHLAVKYNYGWLGLEKDESKAASFYQLATERGHPEATYQLAKTYEFGWLGLEKDESKAASFYQLAAERGHPKAAYDLANIYEVGGLGLEKDESKAASFYQLAAERGHLKAVQKVIEKRIEGTILK